MIIIVSITIVTHGVYHYNNYVLDSSEHRDSDNGESDLFCS